MPSFNKSIVYKNCAALQGASCTHPYEVDKLIDYLEFNNCSEGSGQGVQFQSAGAVFNCVIKGGSHFTQLAFGIGLLAALVLVFAIGTLLIWISLVALRVACHHYIRAVAAMVPSVSLGLRGGFRSPREVQRLMFFADNGRLMFELRSSRSLAIGERAISFAAPLYSTCGRLVQRQASELERRHCKYGCRSIE